MLKPYSITWLNSLTREYMQRKRKSRKGGSYSTLSLLRKELREGNLQSLFGGSPCIVSSSNAAPDPLLSSFISPLGNESASSQSHTHTETRSSKKLSDEVVSKRYFFSISVTSLPNWVDMWYGSHHCFSCENTKYCLYVYEMFKKLVCSILTLQYFV